MCESQLFQLKITDVCETVLLTWNWGCSIASSVHLQEKY